MFDFMNEFELAMELGFFMIDDDDNIWIDTGEIINDKQLAQFLYNGWLLSQI